MVTPGSSFGLSCPSKGLGIQLGVNLTPRSELEPGGFLPKGYIHHRPGRQRNCIFYLAGSYDIEIAHEISRPHGLVGRLTLIIPE